jgi:hypothetical protein
LGDDTDSYDNFILTGHVDENADGGFDGGNEDELDDGLGVGFNDQSTALTGALRVLPGAAERGIRAAFAYFPSVECSGGCRRERYFNSTHRLLLPFYKQKKRWQRNYSRVSALRHLAGSDPISSLAAEPTERAHSLERICTEVLCCEQFVAPGLC